MTFSTHQPGARAQPRHPAADDARGRAEGARWRAGGMLPSASTGASPRRGNARLRAYGFPPERIPPIVAVQPVRRARLRDPADHRCAINDLRAERHNVPPRAHLSGRPELAVPSPPTYLQALAASARADARWRSWTAQACSRRRPIQTERARRRHRRAARRSAAQTEKQRDGHGQRLRESRCSWRIIGLPPARRDARQRAPTVPVPTSRAPTRSTGRSRPISWAPSIA